jgi:pimeloyl-ACP methyl ester carboxylesterase
VSNLTEAPDPELHNLSPHSVQKTNTAGGVLEKVYFLSEMGQQIPGLLWLPGAAKGPFRTVILAQEDGKAAAAQSGFVEPLLEKGYAVLAVDLRGRGETLGRVSERRDNNFPFVGHSIAWDRPAAGRRAFDLQRTVDFVGRRGELSAKSVVVVGVGGDALPALLAAANDPRIRGVACARFVSSFVSNMSAAVAGSRAELIREWNSSAMRFGRIQNGSFTVDLGAVIPSILLTADIPDLASLLAPRKLLYCEALDNSAPDAAAGRSRFERIVKAVDVNGSRWATYLPEKELSASLLLEWLEHVE